VNRLLGRLALVGFFVSLVVHLLTFAGVDVSSRFPYVWLLHAGFFFVWIPFVLLSGKGFQMRRLAIGEIMSGFPTWASVITGAMFAYAILNFFLCDRLMGGGNANIVDGQYVLASHGRFLARLTQSEYHLHKAYELRIFSGTWLVFYSIPGVFFLFWQEPASALDGSIK